MTDPSDLFRSKDSNAWYTIHFSSYVKGRPRLRGEATDFQWGIAAFRKSDQHETNAMSIYGLSPND